MARTGEPDPGVPTPACAAWRTGHSSRGTQRRAAASSTSRTALPHPFGVCHPLEQERGPGRARRGQAAAAHGPTCPTGRSRHATVTAVASGVRCRILGSQSLPVSQGDLDGDCIRLAEAAPKSGAQGGRGLPRPSDGRQECPHAMSEEVACLCAAVALDAETYSLGDSPLAPHIASGESVRVACAPGVAARSSWFGRRPPDATRPVLRGPCR